MCMVLHTSAKSLCNYKLGFKVQAPSTCPEPSKPLKQKLIQVMGANLTRYATTTTSEGRLPQTQGNGLVLAHHCKKQLTHTSETGEIGGRFGERRWCKASERENKRYRAKEMGLATWRTSGCPAINYEELSALPIGISRRRVHTS